MLGLYPADAVRAAEESLMSRVPEGTLMQQAAFGLAVECSRLLREALGYVSGARVVLLVGSGNNGGDALFAGAELQRRGVHVTALLLADRWHAAGSNALIGAGGRVIPGDEADAHLLVGADLIVDGLVGIGASGALRDPMAAAVRRANRADALRVAVDVPSGLSIDDGTVPGEADAVFSADMTVTFGCPKPGHYLFPGTQFSGAVRVVDIGLADLLAEPTWRVLTLVDVLDALPVPQSDTHKYRRGVVGITAGSANYPGAAVLATGGARPMGVGMTVFLDRGDGVAASVLARFPDVVATAEDPRRHPTVAAWVAGPGFLGGPQDAELLAGLLDVEVPVVVDAGALRALARDSELQSRLRARHARGSITVLTPHAGEYAALCGDGADPRDVARDLGSILVRKGPATTITAPDGTAFVDAMGTSALACAGSGDVLSGIIGGLLGAHQRSDMVVDEANAATLVASAVWLHGYVGRCAGRADRPVLATDLMTMIPQAISDVRQGELSW